MNKIFLCGRITKDPEVRYAKSEKQTAIANITLAVNRKFKKDGQPDADFFNCCAFGKTAETIEKYCSKGMKIIIAGSLQNDTYEKDGEKKTITKVMIDEFEFAESKNSNSSKPADAEQAPLAPNGFMSLPTGISDDELPFA